MPVYVRAPFAKMVAEFNSYHSGERYDFRITKEQLLASPPWLDGEPDPECETPDLWRDGKETAKARV